MSNLLLIILFSFSLQAQTVSFGENHYEAINQAKKSILIYKNEVNDSRLSEILEKKKVYNPQIDIKILTKFHEHLGYLGLPNSPYLSNLHQFGIPLKVIPHEHHIDQGMLVDDKTFLSLDPFTNDSSTSKFKRNFSKSWTQGEVLDMDRARLRGPESLRVYTNEETQIIHSLIRTFKGHLDNYSESVQPVLVPSP